jgi:hypothetical protein
LHERHHHPHVSGAVRLVLSKLCLSHTSCSLPPPFHQHSL